MNIQFEDKNLSDPKKRKGKFQHVQPKLERRLAELGAATNIGEYKVTFPGARFHEHSGNEKGIYTIDVSENYRLYFRLVFQEEEENSDRDRLDIINAVTEIIVVKVNDPHKKSH